MARRAASICRAVRRPRPVALRPHSPKETFVPRVARPSLRPLCSLRNLRRLGCSMLSTCLTYALRRSLAFGLLHRTGTRLVAFRLTRSTTRTTIISGRLFNSRLLVAIKHVSLVNPDLDPDNAVGGQRFGGCIIDVGTQRVKWHAAFAIPFGPGDFGTIQAASTHHLDPLSAETHGVLHRTLHGTTEHDAFFELLRDRIGNQLGIDFRLADLFNGHMDRYAHDALKI